MENELTLKRFVDIRRNLGYTQVEFAKVLDIRNTTADIEIGNEMYEKIKLAKSIKIAVSLLTSGADAQPQRSVRISASDYITVGIGISAIAIIDLNKVNSN